MVENILENADINKYRIVCIGWVVPSWFENPDSFLLNYWSPSEDVASWTLSYIHWRALDRWPPPKKGFIIVDESACLGILVLYFCEWNMPLLFSLRCHDLCDPPHDNDGHGFCYVFFARQEQRSHRVIEWMAVEKVILYESIRHTDSAKVFERVTQRKMVIIIRKIFRGLSQGAYWITFILTKDGLVHCLHYLYPLSVFGRAFPLN